MLCVAVAGIISVDEALHCADDEVIDRDRKILFVIGCVCVSEPVAEKVDELLGVEIGDAD